MNIQNELTILQRLVTKTPRLFRLLRIVGLSLTAVSGLLIGLEAEGIVLPEFLGFLSNAATVIAGLTTAGISSLTVDVEAAKQKNAL